MTDKAFQKLIDRCRKAGDLHKTLLKKCEDEYERRWGVNPSEVDDDYWLDTLHYCEGDTDLQKIKYEAEKSQRLNDIM